MSRKGKKKANNQPVVSVPVPSGISAEQWQHIIANATVEAEEMKEQKICPYCKTDLVLRKGKYGEFYGCSNYPKCKYTMK